MFVVGCRYMYAQCSMLRRWLYKYRKYRNKYVRAFIVITQHYIFIFFATGCITVFFLTFLSGFLVFSHIYPKFYTLAKIQFNHTKCPFYKKTFSLQENLNFTQCESLTISSISVFATQLMCFSVVVLFGFNNIGIMK